MSEYESLIDDLTARYPHLVLTVSGPWRDKDGRPDDEPWIVNFRNAAMSLQEVHSGSRGATMTDALKAGMTYLDAHAEDPRVMDHGRSRQPTP